MARTTPFLRYLRIERFGRFHDKTVGPFDEHLNIVYGGNEAGKTTLAAFVGGVLFGWEESGRRPAAGGIPTSPPVPSGAGV